MTYEMPHPNQFAFEESMVWEKQIALAMELIPLPPTKSRAKGILE
jgi:hypothetical protein